MKRMLRIVGWITAAIFALVFIAGVALHTPVAKRYLKDRAVDYVRRRYSAELKIDQLDYSLLRGSVSVAGLSFGPADSKLPPLLRLKHAYVNLDLLKALFGKTSIESIRLDSPDIRLVIDKDGRLNLPELGSKGGGGGNLIIRKLEITDGSLKFEDVRQQIGIVLPAWHALAQGIGTDRTAIHLKTNKNGEATYKEKAFKIGDLELKAELFSSAAKIEKLSLMAAGSKAEGSGEIRDFSSPTIHLKIDTEIDLESAASAIGLDAGMKGRARGTITLTGPLNNLQIGGALQGNVI
jgi:uncharacterized protein involved in outer membrane biogenesis